MEPKIHRVVPRGFVLNPFAGSLALLLALGFAIAPAVAQDSLSGFWEGQIMYAPAEIELDFSVEIAADAEGNLVGSINVPSQEMKYYPLTSVKVEGEQVTFDFHKDSERTANAHFLFEGKLSGDALSGMFTGWYDDAGRNHVPFVLHRTGEAFEAPADEPEPRPVTALSPDGSELQKAFNEDSDDLRLVLLLSPKCGVCLVSARVLDKYVLNEIEGDLQVYLVWGPMLGGEKQEDAVQATTFLADPRVQHFWTPEHTVAQAFAKPLVLGEELAWDTFNLYAPGETWKEGAAPPVPLYYMHVGRSLAADRRFNGEKLAAEVRRILGQARPGGSGEAPPAASD